MGFGGGGSGGGAAAKLKKELKVTGAAFGGLEEGMVFPPGTMHEDVFRAQMIRPIPPQYHAPVLALSGSGVLDVEAGTTISPVLTATFYQNDGGAPGAYRLYQNGGLLASVSPFNVPGFVIGDESMDYVAQRDYAQGPVKNNNLGMAWPTGRIEAGTAVSGIVRYRGLRNLFWGTSQAVADSAGVRALAEKFLNPQHGTSFTINIPAGATRIAFAYPAGLRDVSTIKYVQLSNSEVKDTFSKSTVNVAGADGFTTVAYKVFEYIPAVPFSSAATYTATI